MVTVTGLITIKNVNVTHMLLTMSINIKPIEKRDVIVMITI
jgi:hypothetical protein